MSSDREVPQDIEVLRAALITERARAARVEAELAVAKAKTSDDAALIAHQRLQIEKLTRELYGHRSERTTRLLDQMELAFGELESSECAGLHQEAAGASTLPRAPAARARG
jgi:transposase